MACPPYAHPMSVNFKHIQALRTRVAVWPEGPLRSRQRKPKFHQLQIPSRTKFRRPYPSRAKYGGYDSKSIQNGGLYSTSFFDWVFNQKFVSHRSPELAKSLKTYWFFNILAYSAVFKLCCMCIDFWMIFNCIFFRSYEELKNWMNLEIL